LINNFLQPPLNTKTPPAAADGVDFYLPPNRQPAGLVNYHRSPSGFAQPPFSGFAFIQSQSYIMAQAQELVKGIF